MLFTPQGTRGGSAASEQPPLQQGSSPRGPHVFLLTLLVLVLRSRSMAVSGVCVSEKTGHETMNCSVLVCLCFNQEQPQEEISASVACGNQPVCSR